MHNRDLEDAYACETACRRFSGPLADELYIRCRPDSSNVENAASQAASIYKALNSLLQRERGCLENILQETVFFRKIRRDFEQFQKVRLQAFDCRDSGRALPASICIEQPSLDSGADFVLNAIAVLPHTVGSGVQKEPFFMGGFHGAPGSAFEQASAMFTAADRALAEKGMNFRDVVRTWIYLRDIDRDYAALNMARRAFFQKNDVDPLPASTGVRGVPFPHDTDFALSLYAIRSVDGLQTSPMSTPLLNEAHTYGSDFSRGLRVVEENKIALYVSGTASVDDRGFTLHAGDFESQADRMLLNLETLLAAQNASWNDVLSAVTYLKSPADAPRLFQALQDRGIPNLPNTVVHAALCRADLLCEMEAVAALPLPECGNMHYR